jgi:hypothetical protein
MAFVGCVMYTLPLNVVCAGASWGGASVGGEGGGQLDETQRVTAVRAEVHWRAHPLHELMWDMIIECAGPCIDNSAKPEAKRRRMGEERCVGELTRSMSHGSPAQWSMWK